MRIAGFGGIEFIFILFLAAAAIGAFLVAISYFIDIAKKKGHYVNGGAGMLWYIGIFTTPITVGLYVLMLPDLTATGAGSKAKESQLPPV